MKTHHVVERCVVFNWTHLYRLFCAAFVACLLGTWFAYNGPLTSEVWHNWVVDSCRSSVFAKDGATYGPIVDGLRAALGLALAIYAFHLLQIVPSAKHHDPERALHWIPIFRPTRPSSTSGGEPSIAANFNFERWIIIGFLGFALIVIAVARPLEFLADSHISSPNLSFVAKLGHLYSDDFAEITRPYLIPYSLYIIGLWYCMALPVLLALIRSVYYDYRRYGKLLTSLDVREILKSNSGMPQNVVAVYERRSVEAFAAINEVGRRYSVFILCVIVLCYLQATLLSCSVLEGATDTGKWLLLLLSTTSIAAIAYVYLRLYGEVKGAAKAGIEGISDILQLDESRERELHKATLLSESIGGRDGFIELSKLIGSAGALTVIVGLVWKNLLHENLCKLADLFLPSWLIEQIAKVFAMHCGA